METNHLDNEYSNRNEADHAQEAIRNDDESKNGAIGEDEQAVDVNSSDIDSDENDVEATGTSGGNDEKKDNTPENAREVRDNDRSEGAE